MHSTFNKLARSAFWISVIVLAIASLVPVELLPPQAASIWDKGQHAFGFACLALLGLLAYPKNFWNLILGLTAFGGVIELLQAATGWRYGEWLDFFADIIGLVIGVLLWWILRRWYAPEK